MRAVCWQGANKVGVELYQIPKLLTHAMPLSKLQQPQFVALICTSTMDSFRRWSRATFSGMNSWEKSLKLAVKSSGLRWAIASSIHSRIACGHCFFCKQTLTSLCDNTNPNGWMAEAIMGYSPSGIFGYSHMLGGYAGGQAEYARVPHADVGLFKIQTD